MSVDVAIFRVERRQNQLAFAPQVLADAQDSGRTCTGQEKVAQRFVLQLYTRLGSLPQTTDGSDFVVRLTQGKVTTETDVFVILASAVSDVGNKLKAVETDTDPAAEKLAGVRIMQLTLAAGAADLRLELRFADGTVLAVLIPLNFVLA
jgi:hypothetical protein